MKTHTNYLKLLCIALVVIAGCNSNKKQAELLKSGIHTVVVREIINTTEYSYFRLIELGNPEVKESDTIWVAVPITESSIGDTLYYQKGMPMKNFTSRELNRTFKEVIFLDVLSKSSDFTKKEVKIEPSHEYMTSSDSTNTGKSKIKKIEVKIDPIAGGITIAELYSKKANYSGKSVKIKGQVTKFSPDIMEKNWIHIQDGTESDGKFDLTITSDIRAAEGDIVTLEGKITLDKDLGFDYFYDVIMEDAKIVK